MDIQNKYQLANSLLLVLKRVMNHNSKICDQRRIFSNFVWIDVPV